MNIFFVKKNATKISIKKAKNLFFYQKISILHCFLAKQYQDKIMKNIFDKTVSDEVITRIEKLTPQTQPLWGKMSIEKMLAHCNVTYEMVYEEGKHKKPNALIKFILKSFVKNKVVGEAPFTKNGQTAPQFIIKDERAFEAEKKRLIEHIQKTQELGENYFENKESHSFGTLKAKEWNNMFYKHLDHHLSQFGV